MEEIKPSGLYIIRDQFFADFPNDRYMDNKSESRPHYYAIQDGDGVFWMIPLSSRVEKYREKIAQTEEKHGSGSCFLYMIAQIHGNDRALLICDMFPVTENYILRPYTIGGEAYIIRNEAIRKAINTKAKRYLSMVKRGKLKSPLNILETKDKLLKNK